MDGKIIKRVNSLKQIGLTLTRNMTWDSHIENKHTKAMKKVTLLKLLPPNIPRNTRRQIYISFIRPLIEYANVIIDNCSEKADQMMEKIQRQAALAITRAYKHTKHTDLLKHTGLTSLKQRRHNSKLTLIYKIRNNLTPKYLRDLIPNTRQNRPNTRNRNNISTIKTKKDYMQKSTIPSSINLWNKLSVPLRTKPTISAFKSELKKGHHTEFYKPYLQGILNGHINLSRIRMGLSGLNAHRFRYNFIPTRRCPTCDHPNEDTTHYLIFCPTYAAQRTAMFASLVGVRPETQNLTRNLNNANAMKIIEMLVNGTKNEKEDVIIFDIASKYIENTKRFL